MSTFAMMGDYPGRGVLIRRRSDGGFDWAYFVTGRTELSRSRCARRIGDVVYIEPTGPVSVDPLRHYACARPFSAGLVIGNGDHVDVVAKALDVGMDVEAALEGITPEPDPPINTPRIGAVVLQSSATVFSVAARHGATKRTATELPPGLHATALQTTYQGSVEEPIGAAPLHILSSDAPLEHLVDELWSSLAADLRVLLLVGTDNSVSGCRIVHQQP